ncbi:hypothetical protein ACRALDRAFT_2017106 [Sodiomyces alcalophilus JCM 7366]|uniref:uncharacterized protein n=1 Tax=Sodiomyces alcalophilus JCM 7366 TaxID=591952 RepID=UPI0039B53AC1
MMGWKVELPNQPSAVAYTYELRNGAGNNLNHSIEALRQLAGAYAERGCVRMYMYLRTEYLSGKLTNQVLARAKKKRRHHTTCKSRRHDDTRSTLKRIVSSTYSPPSASFLKPPCRRTSRCWRVADAPGFFLFSVDSSSILSALCYHQVLVACQLACRRTLPAMEQNGTPRARPHLKFANRTYQGSPLNPNKRLGTPQTAPSRKGIVKNDLASSTMNSSSVSSSRNLFRTSSIGGNSTTPFSPKLPAETKTKVFAPGTTPHSQRVYREVTAQATPRGMMRSTSAELFTLRIPSPPPELSGEVLSKKIPPELDAKGTVYADQFLGHLVPSEYDDLQRRQLFCILDLRRLKHSANEVFAKKDWKLNIMNFAKEFEKSRSLIMLRYGLYEFKNVKPSNDVLRKWRAAHGLPDPDKDEQGPDTPSKPSASTKRKAEEDLTPSNNSSVLSATSLNKNKKRAMERDETTAAAASTPVAASNKRKASASEEPDENVPSKMAKSTPSATKALFEKAFNNKSSASPAMAKTAQVSDSAAKPNPFAAASSSQPANGGPARSVFDNLKPPQNAGNIFGYLSDNSARNSGADADAESESDSDDAADTQDTGRQSQSEEPSVDANGKADVPSSQPAANVFGSQKPLFPPAPAAAEASRESTPGRSLFDRVAKGSDGQPLRADSAEAARSDDVAESSGESKDAGPDKKATTTVPPVNATWNPSTPIKFGAGAASSGNLFGSSTTATGTSLFGQKKPASTSSATNLFGAPKPEEKSQDKPEKSQDKPEEKPQEKAEEKPTEKKPTAAKPTQEADKSGESDKENDSQPAKPLFGGFTPKPSEPSTTASSLFQPKPGAADSASTPAATAFSFGAPKSDEPKPAADSAAKPAAPSFSFGAPKAEDASKPKDSVFGAAKPADSSKPTTSLFGSGSTTTPSSGAASNIFGSAAQPTSGAGGASNIFGNASAAATKPSDSAAATSNGASNLFGKPSTPPSFNITPSTSFTFGGDKPSQPAAPASETPKPLFGAASSTPIAPPPANNPLFGGSPMKQDDRPAKKLFGGPSTSTTDQPPVSFNFGASQNGPSSNLFGASSGPSQPSGQGLGGGSTSFSFTSGTGSSDQSFNNPFAFNSGGSGSAAPGSTSAPSGGVFNFGAGSTAPTFGASTSSSSPFQFGAGSSAASSQPAAQPGTSTGSTSSVFAFGANAPSNPTPSANSQAPTQSDNIFAPKPTQPGGSIFGGSLQPPAGGPSTTGTNSPLNLGGASSLATTPATGTPEPTADREKTSASGPSAGREAPGAGGAAGDDSEGKPHEQIKLTEGGAGEEDETAVHEVRSKVLKFVPASEAAEDSGGEGKGKSKSPWVTRGIGPFRLLKHKTSGAVRMVVRAEPRGHVVLNRVLLPNETYKNDGKYVKLLTSNETGDGLETYMVQVKNPEVAKELAAVLEKHKGGNTPPVLSFHFLFFVSLSLYLGPLFRTARLYTGASSDGLFTPRMSERESEHDIIALDSFGGSLFFFPFPLSFFSPRFPAIKMRGADKCIPPFLGSPGSVPSMSSSADVLRSARRIVSGGSRYMAVWGDEEADFGARIAPATSRNSIGKNMPQNT